MASGKFTDESLLLAFSEEIGEFQIRDWEKLFSNRLTEEETKQYRIIFYVFGFQFEERGEISVWSIFSEKFAESLLDLLDVGVAPFSEGYHLKSLFQTPEDLLLEKRCVCEQFIKTIVSFPEIREEACVELPKLLRKCVYKELEK